MNEVRRKRSPEVIIKRSFHLKKRLPAMHNMYKVEKVDIKCKTHSRSANQIPVLGKLVGRA